MPRKPKPLVRPMAQARSDGRPLYFDVPYRDERYHCAKCAAMGLSVTWPHTQVVMNDPANAHNASGAVYTYCLAHIPDNAVIFTPGTNKCRDKKGKRWTEDQGESIFKRG